MFFLALFLLGVVSLSRLELELFPDISMPTVAIFTAYPGVGPYEVESGVTKPLEEVLSSLSGVEQISSTSSEGVSLVILNFEWSKNLDNIVSEVREQISKIEGDLPEGVDRPGIFKFNPQNLPTLVINVYAKTRGFDIRRLAEREIVPFLEKVEGVAQAEVYGGAESAVVCRLNLDEIGKLNIPVTQVLQAFSGENVDLPGGSLTIEDSHVILRTIGEFSSVDDIGHVLVGYRQDVPVFLKDVADISMDSVAQEQFVRAGGEEGVMIAVQRQPGFNTVLVNERIIGRLDSLLARLPSSIEIAIRTDQSVSVKQSIGGVATAAWQGGFLAVLVLLLFLRNLRSTLIAAVVIPFSVVVTFSLMDFGGLSMNMVSLMGITLGVGMFVDNSIVVLESVYRKQLAGLSREDAAREGTAEVAKPIVASTLTTVAVFLPMLFVEGIAGLIFDDLALTISFALVVSLSVALTFIPLLCAKVLKIDPSMIRDLQSTARGHDLSLADISVQSGNRFVDKTARMVQGFLRKLDDAYERTVSWAIDHSLVVIALAVLLFCSSIGSILLLGMEFLPETDEGEFSIYMETRSGASYDVTTRKVVEVERLVNAVCGDDLDIISSQVGRSGSLIDAGNVGSNLAMVHLKLVHKSMRERSIWEYMREIDTRMADEVLDLQYSLHVEGIAALASSASGETSPIVVELTGDNLDGLYQYAKRIEAEIGEIEGVRSPRISHRTGRPELQFRVKRREALALGLSPFEIATTIRAAYKGMTVSRYNEDEISYDVVVILREEDRTPERFPALYFVNPAGMRIPLENLVDIEEGTGPLSVSRKGRTRIIAISADLTGERPLNRVMTDVRNTVDSLGPRPLGIELAYTGTSLEMAESYSSLFIALLAAVALVYMVMASQFESLLHPFIVMFSVPFAIIGLVAALLVTGTTFNLLAFVGGILLVGIVVNNAIVLIDYINLLRSRGLSLREAIVKGGKTRLKPILMTSLTTIFGLLPMSLGFGLGSEMRAPMGRAVVGGLTTSTIVTLVLIPVIYWIVESRLEKRRMNRSRRPGAASYRKSMEEPLT